MCSLRETIVVQSDISVQTTIKKALVFGTLYRSCPLTVNKSSVQTSREHICAKAVYGEHSITNKNNMSNNKD